MQRRPSYLPWLGVTQGRPIGYLLPAAAALAAFAWLFGALIWLAGMTIIALQLRTTT